MSYNPKRRSVNRNYFITPITNVSDRTCSPWDQLLPKDWIGRTSPRQVQLGDGKSGESGGRKQRAEVWMHGARERGREEDLGISRPTTITRAPRWEARSHKKRHSFRLAPWEREWVDSPRLASPRLQWMTTAVKVDKPLAPILLRAPSCMEMTAASTSVFMCHVLPAR